MNNPDSKIIAPAKPNLDVPKGAPPVERAGSVQSPNPAGGEVARQNYSSKP